MKKENDTIVKKTIRFYGIFALIICVYIILSVRVISINFVDGNSMSPTVKTDGIVITNKLVNDYKQFDIVLASVPNSDGKHNQIAIKRIVALPNDKLLIKDGMVYVNGKPLDDYNFDTEDIGICSEEITLKDDEYFLMGDNRSESFDSRFYGAIKKENMLGKVVKILYKGE